jgi:hypothetical protein
VLEVDSFDLFEESVHEVLPRLLAVADDVEPRILLALDPQQRRIELGLLQRGALRPPLRPQLLRLGEPFGLRQAAGDSGTKHGDPSSEKAPSVPSTAPHTAPSGHLPTATRYRRSAGAAARLAARRRQRGSASRGLMRSMTSSISRWLAMLSARPRSRDCVSRSKVRRVRVRRRPPAPAKAQAHGLRPIAPNSARAGAAVATARETAALKGHRTQAEPRRNTTGTTGTRLCASCDEHPPGMAQHPVARSQPTMKPGTLVS